MYVNVEQFFHMYSRRSRNEALQKMYKDGNQCSFMDVKIGLLWSCIKEEVGQQKSNFKPDAGYVV